MWLANTLYSDHQALIARAPDRVAAKYALMESTAWRFFRGTAPQFFRDLADAGSPIVRTFQFQSAATSRLWLVGDPHFENIGTALLDDGDLSLSFNDFDATRPGPYHADVLRLGTSLQLLCHPSLLDDAFVPPTGCDDLAGEMAGSYAETIALVASGESARPLRWSVAAARGGVIAEDLFRRAERDRTEAAVFGLWVSPGELLVRGPLEEPSLAGVLPEGGETLEPSLAGALERALTGACDAAVRARASGDAWTAWASEGGALDGPVGEGCAVLDVVRREGVGVASHALERFVALVAAPDSDGSRSLHLVDVKEAWDPPFFRELRVLPQRLAVDNAHRITTSRSALSPPEAADPFNLPLAIGAMSLRTASLLASEKGFSIKRIRAKSLEGAFRMQELRAFSRLVGRLLAEAHARSSFVDAPSRAPASVIAGVIGQAHDGFVLAVADASHELARQTLLDYELFLRMRAASTNPIYLVPVSDNHESIEVSR